MANVDKDAKSAVSPQEAKSATSAATGTAHNPSGKPKRQRDVVEVTNDLPPVWDPSDKGEALEGFYVGPRVINYRGKPFLTHVIQDEETGELNSFSGAIADRKMTRLPKGSWCRVVYNGKTRTSGGFDAKDFTLSTEKGVRLLDETEALGIARELISNARAAS